MPDTPAQRSSTPATTSPEVSTTDSSLCSDFEEIDCASSTGSSSDHRSRSSWTLLEEELWEPPIPELPTHPMFVDDPFWFDVDHNLADDVLRAREARDNRTLPALRPRGLPSLKSAKRLLNLSPAARGLIQPRTGPPSETAAKQRGLELQQLEPQQHCLHTAAQPLVAAPQHQRLDTSAQQPVPGYPFLRHSGSAAPTFSAAPNPAAETPVPSSYPPRAPTHPRAARSPTTVSNTGSSLVQGPVSHDALADALGYNITGRKDDP